MVVFNGFLRFIFFIEYILRSSRNPKLEDKIGSPGFIQLKESN